MANQRIAGFIAKPRNPMYGTGKKLKTVHAYAALVTATMANGDTVELGGPFTFDQRVHRIITPAAMAAFTSAAGAKLGFGYKQADGTFKFLPANPSQALTSDAVLWNGVSLAAAQTAGTDLLKTLNAALDSTKNIADILGLTNESEPARGVYLVLTFPTKPSVNSTIDWDVIVEEATTK